MDLSHEGDALIRRFEACRLAAYRDSGGLPTIGVGTTRYPDGRRVQIGDTCTDIQANNWFRHDLSGVVADVDRLTVDSLTQTQFDALVSLAYNIGLPAFKGSTLRRRVNANPNDPAIRKQFMAWRFDNGKAVKGLWRRRHLEADCYFNVSTPLPEFPG